MVPTIMLTCGTTDTFAIDDISSVRRTTERLCRKYHIPRSPHIHVDAAVGWSILFFLDYDIGTNPLAINPATLKSLSSLKSMMKGLKEADSFTVDFQKWGYAPYTSSLLMVRDRQDFEALRHQAIFLTLKISSRAKHIFSQRSNVPEEQLEYFLPIQLYNFSVKKVTRLSWLMGYKMPITCARNSKR